MMRARLKATLSGLRMRIRGATILNEAGVRIHLSPSDGRAQSIYRSGGVHDSDAVGLWREIIAEVDPTVLIDVGANYGEVGLSVPLESRTLHLVEPNPRVLPMLRRTVSPYPNVLLHECAAGSETGNVELHMPRNQYGVVWSGVASIVRAWGPSVTIPVARLEDLMGVDSTDRVAFKIDVEDYEIPALRGLKGILETAEAWVGMCETTQVEAIEREGFAVTPAGRNECVLR